MAILEGTLSRGEVTRLHISHSATANTTQQFDLPAGAYDIEVVVQSGLTVTAGTPTAALKMFTSTGQSSTVTLYGGTLAATSTTSVIPINAGTPTHFTISPQVSPYRAHIIPYGLLWSYTAGTTVTGTLTGELLVRRR